MPPDARAIQFLISADPEALYLSILTIGELRQAAARKRRAAPHVARELDAWVDGLEARFADRILGLDAETMRVWGELCGERSRPGVESLLAATAIRHKLTLVTGNAAGLDAMGVSLLDLWE